jgi:hypothetical protein
MGSVDVIVPLPIWGLGKVGNGNSCEDRVDASLVGTVEVLRDLWNWMEKHGDEYHPEHQVSLYDYGLSFDYVEPETFTDEPRGYWRYQLSWGGPSDEFRFFDAGYDGTIVEYWFLDWWDGAHRVLSGEDRELLLGIYDWMRCE